MLPTTTIHKSLFTFFLLVFFFPSKVWPVTANLELVDTGFFTLDGTQIFSGDINKLKNGSGVSRIESVVITDDGIKTGGNSGVFSGFDVDAIVFVETIVFDVNGGLVSTDEAFFPKAFFFTAGTTRPTESPREQSTSAHPGPTFGSLTANLVDENTATLKQFDANRQPDPPGDLPASGFLSLGDGGKLGVNFPRIELDSVESLFLLVGEVGSGEFLIDVEVSTTAIPEPATILLMASGLVGLVGYRLKRNRKL